MNTRTKKKYPKPYIYIPQPLNPKPLKPLKPLQDIPHEVLKTQRKRFAVTLWLAGPAGPGDQPEGHHTST